MKIKRANPRYPIHNLSKKRWSPRAFNGEPVETEKLQRIFEAARWSPSASNEQPWAFIVGMQGDETYDKIFSTLVEFNQLWVKTAPLLAISAGRSISLKNGMPAEYFKYDVGQAMAHLTFQATYEGLYVHQMAGFDREKAHQLLEIPEKYEVISAFTIGYPGDYKMLHKNLQAMEIAPRERLHTDDFVFSGTFGHAAEWITREQKETSPK
ncbi:MAG TPA: nitroreductase family protein [Bacteroidales bacterium]|nr:nitroreductase family protein [Bacteroidales bacterium]